MTVQPSQDVYADEATNPACAVDENAQPVGDCPVVTPGAGTQAYNVHCASGNVTGGGIKSDDTVQEVQSYPLNDSTWHFEVVNIQDAAETVNLRVICI